MNATRTRTYPTVARSQRNMVRRMNPCAAGVLVIFIVLLNLSFLPHQLLGQGTVNFNNRLTSSGFVTHVFEPEFNLWSPKYGNTSFDMPAGTQTYQGNLLTGNGWNAQLWAAPGANQPEHTLQAAFPITTFRTGTAAGCVAGVTATLTGVPVDYPIATVQMRVWPSSFSNWEKASQYFHMALIPAGFSQPFNVTNIGGGVYAAPILRELRSFSLYWAPDDNHFPPVVLEHPQSVTTNMGATVVFNAYAGSMIYTSTLRWRHNNTNLPGLLSWSGGTNVSLILTNVQSQHAGVYSIIVTNDYGQNVSSNATLIIGNPGPLTVSRDSFGAMLTWSGAFVLQSATNITGPFSDLPGPVVFGPYTNTDFSSPRFFRLRN